MPQQRSILRGLVLGWTIFTTTFVWTPTMRLVFKPEIHQWSLFGLSGAGRGGMFWVLPLLVCFALFLFYIEGRGRLRGLFFTLLLGWHLFLSSALLYSSFRHGMDSTFEGGAWGVVIPFPILAIPFTAFAVLAVIWAVQETKGLYTPPRHTWGEIGLGELLAAVVLFAPVWVLFRVGEGFNIWVKLAIVLNVLQWILLTDAVGRPSEKRDEAEQAIPDRADTA